MAVPRVLQHSAVTDEEAEELARLATGQTVLELGALFGRSTVAMASTARVVISVDWHRGDPHAGDTDTLNEYLTNIAPFPNVVPIVARIEKVVPLFSSMWFGLVFHDAYHAAEAVLRDLAPLKWSCRYVALHDWCDDFPGVKEGAEAAGLVLLHRVGNLALCEWGGDQA